jgi:hypothetical protein
MKKKASYRTFGLIKDFMNFYLFYTDKPELNVKKNYRQNHLLYVKKKNPSFLPFTLRRKSLRKLFKTRMFNDCIIVDKTSGSNRLNL